MSDENMESPQDAERAPASEHPLDECECGDYRRDHVGGRGACSMPNNMSHGFQRCERFRLSKPFAGGAR